MRSRRYERDRERSATVAALQTKAPHVPPDSPRRHPPRLLFPPTQSTTQVQSCAFTLILFCGQPKDAAPV